MRKYLCVMLSAILLFTAPAVSAQPRYAWGDLDNSGRVDAADALLVLQYAVDKVNLSEDALAVANVSDTGKIDAQDALMILQYAVKRLERFPADTAGMTDEEIYYRSRDRYYGVNGSDFIYTTITDFEDAAFLVNTLGQVAGDRDIEGYALNDEWNVIYNPISKAAKEQGVLSLYNTANKTKGSITLSDGTVFAYEVPTHVTAYSAVPLKYSLQGGAGAGTVHVEATTWEEPERLPAGMDTYYENTLPGDVNIAVTYDGYVQAENLDGSLLASWNANITDDVMGTQYPHYTPSELVASGTIPAGKETWLKFTFTNTGKTVLKGDGQGYFNLRPMLYKKVTEKVYNQVATNDNYAYRLYDALYPGESRSVWVRFTGYASYPVGEYKVVLESQIANEQGSPEWTAMYVGGRGLLESSFAFTVSDTPAVTPPNEVITEPKKNNYDQPVQVVRNGWLGTYEEFQTSFQTHLFVNTQAPETETLYFQPAPWNQTLTLRVISDGTGAVEVITLPLQVESDSISITLNPYNEHYVIMDDGTREPMLAIQNMADMRGNNQDTPYPMETIVNDLQDMRQAGVNYLTSTMAFTYSTGTSGFANASNRVMMDLVSLMGFSFEGYGSYPYEGSIDKSYITRGYAGVDSSIGTNRMNGILNNWVYERFGDVFWSNGAGITPIAQEDSRGWLTIDHDWRMDLDNATVAAYQEWLQSVYGDIDTVNQVYGSQFAGFEEIDPRTEGMSDSTGHYNFTALIPGIHVFHEESKAIKDLDLFRTVNRIRDYKESLMVTDVPGAKMIARYESSPLITVGLRADTTNTRYRETYYQMYRAGLVGEVLSSAADEILYGTSTYQNTPYSPAETYELTKHAQQNGISVMNYHMHHREQIYNTFYGDSKAAVNLHLANQEMKVTSINTTAALFPVFKATYEAGGIPAVMWMDYYCNGFVTSTMYKELQFYTAKIHEMLETQEGHAWATQFEVGGSTVNENAAHVFSYDPDYLLAEMAKVTRWNKFNLQ